VSADIKPKRKRVLVADDDLAQRRMLQFCLEQLGYEVTTASDGARAVALALTRQFDAVMLDYEMPNMNGVEALQEIRKEDGYAETFIVMLTGHIQDDLVYNAYVNGVDMYLTKPIDMKMLARIFKRSV
jgi:CheY-like chemotaxis protein